MIADLDLLADRHFRPDPQGVLAPKGEGKCGRVLVTVTQTLAGTPAGQHLAWMLVNQLARQFGVVAEIALDIANAPLLENTAAFGTKDTLRDTLEECVRLVAGKHVGVLAKFEDTYRFDLHIVVGVSNGRELANQTLCVYADGWRWYVGNGKNIPTLTPLSSLSFGPYMAASFAAGEVYKNLRKILPNKGSYVTECFGSAWTMSLGEGWDSLVDGPGLNEIPVLPHFYFAGAGAVAQAAALTIGSSRIKGTASAVDHDKLDVTNDNRYVLSTLDDQEESKAELLSSYLTDKAFPCHHAPVKWSAYVSTNGKTAMNQEIAALEQQHRFPIVLSCVDKNLPRHEMQTLLPKIIIGGSTDGLVAKVSTFYLGHEAACLKCFNPVEDRNISIRQNREKLVNMNPEQRNEWCRERGILVDVLERFLSKAECSKLSEADLERFAEGSPDMSVGFVSVTAGVLLLAQLIRVIVLGIDKTTVSGHTIAVTFAKVGIRYLKSGPETSCNCRTQLRSTWHRLWEK